MAGGEVQLVDLIKEFDGVRAVDGINLDIQRGKVTAILGPSGTGKTTLLRLIGAQLAPSGGSVLVEGQDVQKLGQTALYALRKRMGMLFQNGALLTDLTVFENVAFPVREHTNLSPALLRTLVLMKLEMVGLRGARDLYPRELSGGMARRVALARAIALDVAEHTDNGIVDVLKLDVISVVLCNFTYYIANDANQHIEHSQ